MGKIIAAFCLVLLAAGSSAIAGEEAPLPELCGSKLNGFGMSSRDGRVRVSISGHGQKTLATQVLNYMIKAGSAAGVKTSDFELPLGGENKATATNYKLDRLSVTKATSWGLCPALSFTVSYRATEKDQWSMSAFAENGRATIRVLPSARDSKTFVKLMKASGVIAEPLQDSDGVSYASENIFCRVSSPERGEISRCFLTIDPAE